MKKVVIRGERQAELVDVPEPEPREDWVVVKNTVVPMCTEYKAWLRGAPNSNLGHEAVGEVVAVAQPGPVAVGDRVVVMPLYPCGTCDYCRAGDYIYCQNQHSRDAFPGSKEGSATYAQYMLKPAWLLPPIPDGMSDEMAALSLCALAPSFGAMDTMQVDAFDTLLITGAGPVGLGAVVNAKYRGARVILVEGIPYRQEYARKLGADVVIDPADPNALAQVLDLTREGRGVDKALDCSGVVAAERFCIDATRRLGQVTFIGECNDELTLRVSPDLIRKGLTVRGSWHYNLNLVPKIMQVIQESPVADQIVSHRFAMSEVQDALALSASHQCAKILLDPWA
jgi:threonine dehydrogenase-like Zn-dependent dehydrogenase